MIYALTRADGGVTVTWVLPKEITVDGYTLPVTMTDGTNKTLHAQDGDRDRTFPLPSDDMRSYEVDSVPGAVLAFHDIQKVMDDSPGTYVACNKITVDQIPDSRSYRDAWAVNGTTLVHDMAKAREMHRDILREARKPMLEALDVAYQRADEQDDGPLKRRIAAEKQKLRDITANALIEQAATVEDLAPLTVDYLLAHP